MATAASRPAELSGRTPGLRLQECGDETLASLVAAADDAAFAVLYERHYQALYRYCRSIVRDDLDAQDALQTAWTSVLVALRHGRRDAPVRPWLYRIVHNEAISALRRRRRRAEPSEALAHGDPPAPTAPGVPSAEDSAIARERFALLMADLGRLPERPRGALLMRELSGLTHEEIAAALQTSVAAAKQCVYEARRDLAELAHGRAAPCDEICSSISGGDRRVLRGRRVSAHLRDCPTCASFAAAMDERRGALHAGLPWLPAPAAIIVLDQVLHAGSGASAAAGASGAAASGFSAAGGAGPLAAAGAAGPAAVAGGVVTKALGASALAKAALAAAAVGAGVASLGGAVANWHGAAHPAAAVRHAAAGHSHRTAGSRSRPVTSRRSTVAHPASSPSPGRRVAAGPTGGGASAPGQARKAGGASAPGRARKAGGAPAPGQAKTAGGAPASGQAKTAGGIPSPRQAKAAIGTAHGRGAAAGSSHGRARSNGHPAPAPASHVAAATAGSAKPAGPPRPQGNGSPNGHSTATGKLPTSK